MKTNEKTDITLPLSPTISQSHCEDYGRQARRVTTA